MNTYTDTKSFRSVVFTHFCTTVNDNLYKVLLILFLLKIAPARSASFIVGVTSFLFVLPFLFLASVAGSLSDKYSKSKIILITRIIEVLGVILGSICLYYKFIPGCYFVLLILGIHTAIFSPSKFGILPEIMSIDLLSNANGIMTSVTYISSIFGTFLASCLTQITHYHFFETSLVCVFLSLCGFVASLKIKKTIAQAPQSEIKWEFLSTVVNTIKITCKKRFLLSSIVLGAVFFFLATSVQLNMVNYVKESLNFPHFVGGYLLIATSLGIGIGAFLTGKISKGNIELAFTPIMGVGLGLSLCFLFLFQHNIYLIIPVLFFLGVFGGSYIVPLHAFVQYASPNKARGTNIAVANFLDFFGMLLASLSVFIFGEFLHFQVASIFFGLGIFAVCVSLFLFFLWYEQVLRFICNCYMRLSTKLVITDIPGGAETFLLANVRSKEEAIIFFSSLPKRIHIVLSPSLKKYFLFKVFLNIFPHLFLKKKKTVAQKIKWLKECSETMDTICLVYDERLEKDSKFVAQLKQAKFWTFFSLKILKKEDSSSHPYIVIDYDRNKEVPSF